ncbi:hypothetical protein TSAR_004444, partial [Trichomalopsis sarcophagae]
MSCVEPRPDKPSFEREGSISRPSPLLRLLSLGRINFSSVTTRQTKSERRKLPYVVAGDVIVLVLVELLLDDDHRRRLVLVLPAVRDELVRPVPYGEHQSPRYRHDDHHVVEAHVRHVHEIHRQNLIADLRGPLLEHRTTIIPEAEERTDLQTAAVVNSRLQCYPRDEYAVVPIHAVALPDVESQSLTGSFDDLDEMDRVLWILNNQECAISLGHANCAGSTTSEACLPICLGSMTLTTISPCFSTASRAAAVEASWSFSTVSNCLKISFVIPLTCNRDSLSYTISGAVLLRPVEQRLVVSGKENGATPISGCSSLPRITRSRQAVVMLAEDEWMERSSLFWEACVFLGSEGEVVSSAPM